MRLSKFRLVFPWTRLSPKWLALWSPDPFACSDKWCLLFGESQHVICWGMDPKLTTTSTLTTGRRELGVRGFDEHETWTSIYLNLLQAQRDSSALNQNCIFSPYLYCCRIDPVRLFRCELLLHSLEYTGTRWHLRTTSLNLKCWTFMCLFRNRDRVTQGNLQLRVGNVRLYHGREGKKHWLMLERLMLSTGWDVNINGVLASSVSSALIHK